MSASVYKDNTQGVADNGDVGFTDVSALSNATLISSTQVQLGGSGTPRLFLVSWGVLKSTQNCTFGVTVDGVAQPALRFGLDAVGSTARHWLGGQAVVSIADNAVLTLRNLTGSGSCFVQTSGGLGNGASAYLTVVLIE